jgi:hypothetical protein
LGERRARVRGKARGRVFRQTDAHRAAGRKIVMGTDLARRNDSFTGPARGRSGRPFRSERDMVLALAALALQAVRARCPARQGSSKVARLWRPAWEFTGRHVEHRCTRLQSRRRHAAAGKSDLIRADVLKPNPNARGFIGRKTRASASQIFGREVVVAGRDPRDRFRRRTVRRTQVGCALTRAPTVVASLERMDPATSGRGQRRYTHDHRHSGQRLHGHDDQQASYHDERTGWRAARRRRLHGTGDGEPQIPDVLGSSPRSREAFRRRDSSPSG